MSDMKFCTKCQLNKHFTSIKNSWCQDCSKQYSSEWRIANKNKKKEADHLWYLENKEHSKQKYNEWKSNNKEKRAASWRQWHNEKLANDPVYKLMTQCRKLISQCFKRRCASKQNNKSIEVIGMSGEQLFSYLNQTFITKYGRLPCDGDILHIDHIVPISQANTTEEVIELCHYTNLQLLLAKDNLSKSNKESTI